MEKYCQEYWPLLAPFRFYDDMFVTMIGKVAVQRFTEEEDYHLHKLENEPTMGRCFVIKDF